MNKAIQYLRSNAIALLALFTALGGTSYAALNLPAGSVGTRQLRDGAVTANKLANRSVTPIKFDPAAIGGSIRHWAHVSQDGRILGGSRGVVVSGRGPIFHVSWGGRFSSRCAALVTPAGNAGTSPIADTTGVVVVNPGTGQGTTVVYVTTYIGGVATPAPFDVAVLC